MTNRHRQCLNAVGSGNKATVAKGLFREGLILFNEYAIIAIQLLIPLNRSEVCG